MQSSRGQVLSKFAVILSLTKNRLNNPSQSIKTASPISLHWSKKRTKSDHLRLIDITYLSYHGAQKQKGSSGLVGGAIKGTAKATSAVSTMGLSLMYRRLVKKDKMTLIILIWGFSIVANWFVNNRDCCFGWCWSAFFGCRRYVWTYWSGCRWYRIQTWKSTSLKILGHNSFVTSNDFNKLGHIYRLHEVYKGNNSPERIQKNENAQRIMGALDVIVHNS